MRSILRWSPRVLSLLFAAFIGMFALDVFNGPWRWTALLAFAFHLIPAFVVLAVALAGWRWPLVGALGFFALAGGHVLMVGLDRHWSWYASISGPALLVSLLFFADWLAARETKPNRTSMRAPGR